MPCSYKPVNKPYDFMNLSPAYQWGIGRVAGYTHFDQAEFIPLVGESRIDWEINFNDKASGKTSPHKITVENKDHIFHYNVLRGSRFLASPVMLFNGAQYVQNSPRDDSARAMTQEEGQGLMFYWDDFIGDYGVVKAGDELTITVDVRLNGTAEENGGRASELVRLKATPNFSEPDQISSQEIGEGFTRVIFRTTIINTEWLPSEGWEDKWGAVNPPVPDRVGRTWNKDRLIGVVQNVDNVQLEMARPQVSREGYIDYREASADIITNNQFKWDGFKKGYRLLDNGQYTNANYPYDWADPAFKAIPSDSQWQRIKTFTVMKFTKLPFELQSGDFTPNLYGKVSWYSSNSEASFIQSDLFSREDGKYGGELSVIKIPEGAKYFRLHVTAFSQQAAEFRMGFNDISYVHTSSATSEITQEMYEGVTSMLDGKTAKAYADNYYERVKIDYHIDLIAEIKKVLPNAFDGLDRDQSVELVRSLAYMMKLTATARGGDDDNTAHWHMKNKDNVAGSIFNFKGDNFTTYTHLSTWQDWIQDDGTLWGYFYTEAPAEGVGQQAWVELDYFKIDMSIVATNTDIANWNYQSSNSSYTLTSIDTPMMRTEENMQNSSVQVTHGYDIYGEVFKQYPEFFGDCYTYEDCITKLNERIKSFTFEVESYIPDPDIGGEGYVNFVVEATDRIRDSKTRLTKNTQNFITVSNERGNFVKENGYIYLGGERPPEDRNIELGMMSNITFQLWMDRKYDNDKRIFRYNKKKQPWFLFVRDIKRSVLPPKVNNLVDMNRGRNRYSYGQTEEARSITLNCFIKAESEMEMAPLLEELADYLDVGETTLQLYDSPERVYKVVLDGSTDISQNLHMGEITLNLILLDNYAIGKEVVVRETYTEDTSIPFLKLENEGTAPTHPKYLLDFKKDSQFVDLIGEQESANISIGRRTKSSPADNNKNLRPQVFYSKFKNDDGAGWVSLNDTLMPQYIETQKPTLSGSIQRSNGMMNLNGWNYGDKNVAGLHGHGVIGTLKKNVNNFVCEITPAIYGNSPKNSLNAIYVIFYDEVNNPICHAKIGTRPEDGNIDMYLLEDGNNVNWGRFHQTNGNKWDDFKGKFVVERKNNKWRLTAGQYSNRKFDPAPESNFNLGTSMLKDTKSTGWVTLPTETWNRPVARVGLYLATWKDRPLASHLSVRRCIVWEDLTEEATSPQEKPIVINAGDQVLVDSEKGQVYLNGVITPKLVDPMTDWFSVDKGENLIGVNNFVGDLTVIYNERFK